MTTPRASTAHTRHDSTAGATPTATDLSPPLPLPTLDATPPSLPLADTFDFLPAISALLRRLQQPSGLDGASTTSVSQGAAGGGGASESERDREKEGRLELPDLQSAAGGVRRRIARARAVVGAMPDVHRGLGELEGEVAELEERVTAQRAVLASLGVGVGDG